MSQPRRNRNRHRRYVARTLSKNNQFSWRSNNNAKQDNVHAKPIRPVMKILQKQSTHDSTLENPFERKESLYRHKPSFTLEHGWDTQTNADKVFRYACPGDTKCTTNVWKQLMYCDIIEQGKHLVS